MTETDGAPVLVWFRRDLRLADNPALSFAAETGRPVLALFVLDEVSPGVTPIGAAQRWWLHRSLQSLQSALETRGVPLALRRGSAFDAVLDVAREVGAGEVVWNRLYEPALVHRDTAIKESLSRDGRTVRSFPGALLHEPWAIRNAQGEPFKVFSAFWRASLRLDVPAALPEPPKMLGVSRAPKSERLSAWKLLPDLNWADGFDAVWTPGEEGARTRLTAFLDHELLGYADLRNRPDRANTSRLSPHLHFGEISPRQIWERAHAARHTHSGREADTEKFLSELGWREFSAHLLFSSPDLAMSNWRSAFDAFPWREDPDGLRAWTKGLTGYPIVDAGMRELWATGWMHNRVRMIVASFLIKDLLIDWRKGAAWFWDTLVDADLANNSASWQWVAGSGADAAPYFRIFNPVSQGRTYDPEGTYVRRWVPELAKLPNAHLHAPFAAPPEALTAAGITLGRTYPLPIVDHAMARRRALAAFESLSR